MAPDGNLLINVPLCYVRLIWSGHKICTQLNKGTLCYLVCPSEIKFRIKHLLDSNVFEISKLIKDENNTSSAVFWTESRPSCYCRCTVVIIIWKLLWSLFFASFFIVEFNLRILWTPPKIWNWDLFLEVSKLPVKETELPVYWVQSVQPYARTALQ